MNILKQNFDRLYTLIDIIRSPDIDDKQRDNAYDVISLYGLDLGHSPKYRKINNIYISDRRNGLDVINPEIVLNSLHKFYTYMQNILKSKNRKIMFCTYKNPLMNDFETLFAANKLFSLKHKWIGGGITNIAFASMFYLKNFQFKLSFIPEIIVNLSPAYGDLILSECKKTGTDFVSCVDTNNDEDFKNPLFINKSSPYTYILIYKILTTILS